QFPLLWGTRTQHPDVLWGRGTPIPRYDEKSGRLCHRGRKTQPADGRSSPDALQKSGTMKKFVLPILVLMMLHGCGERKKEAPQGEPVQSPGDSISLKREDPMAREYSSPYFKAQGTEPFWGLNILGDRIVLSRMMGDSLVLPHPEPIRVQDSNIKMYRTREGDTTMDVIITQKECINAMSGEVFPYGVTI